MKIGNRKSNAKYIATVIDPILQNGGDAGQNHPKTGLGDHLQKLLAKFAKDGRLSGRTIVEEKAGESAGKSHGSTIFIS
jgi:hypothetical protein